MLTPSAVSTSAEPDLEDRPRLPCLATGTPAPATTIAAAVEMLWVPARVAAGAAGVDRVLRRRDPGHALAQAARAGGDLLHRLAAHAQRHQQARDLGRRGVAGHHQAERLAGLGLLKRRAGRCLGDQLLEALQVGGHAAPADPRQLEEIAQQRVAVLGLDALGMELDAVDRQGRCGAGP